MIQVLIDTNVLIDVAVEDPHWFDWSAQQLHDAVEQGWAAINPIIYAEVSVNYDSQSELDQFLNHNDYARLPLPWEAGFLAGKVFYQYRQRGGERKSPLADFYIGAHAQIAGLTLLTRDVNRYRTYFPQVPLISP